MGLQHVLLLDSRRKFGKFGWRQSRGSTLSAEGEDYLHDWAGLRQRGTGAGFAALWHGCGTVEFFAWDAGGSSAADCHAAAGGGGAGADDLYSARLAGAEDSYGKAGGAQGDFAGGWEAGVGVDHFSDTGS